MHKKFFNRSTHEQRAYCAIKNNASVYITNVYSLPNSFFCSGKLRENLISREREKLRHNPHRFFFHRYTLKCTFCAALPVFSPKSSKTIFFFSQTDDMKKAWKTRLHNNGASEHFPPPFTLLVGRKERENYAKK
jgi:hypothetical protein